MTGKFPACVFNELLKAEPGIDKTPLKGARAKAKLFRDIFQRRSLPGHGSAESLLHLFADVCARILRFEFRLQVHADHLQQLFVMSHEWRVQVMAAKNQSVAVRFEMHPA